ncbi:MAG: hypothetical protein U5L03_02670 [Burkholderiaceae bacterium]|nr:hypothetical protein [Burkholderiaceae bacterium]
MTPTLGDRFTPTAVGVVSRAWVIGEVMRVPALSDARRRQLVDQVCDYQPPRKYGLRDNFIAWLILLGGAALFNTLDLPGWIGFVIGLAVLTALARVLAVKALRWRLQRLLAEAGEAPMSVEDARG